MSELTDALELMATNDPPVRAARLREAIAALERAELLDATFDQARRMEAAGLALCAALFPATDSRQYWRKISRLKRAFLDATYGLAAAPTEEKP